MLMAEIVELIDTLRQSGEDGGVEAKSAAGRVPAHLAESVFAFATTTIVVIVDLEVGQQLLVAECLARMQHHQRVADLAPLRIGPADRCRFSTAGCWARTRSTSAGYTFSPPVMIMSLDRPET